MIDPVILKEVTTETTGASRRKFNFSAELPTLFTGIFSKDPLTRKMGFFFYFSLVGLISVSTLCVERYLASKRSAQAIVMKHNARELAKKAEKQKDSEKYRLSLMTLGSFTLELIREITDSKPASGVMNLAELEVVLLCDGEDTREYLQDHMVEAKNQMTDVLTAVHRDDLMSRDGKHKMKVLIIKRLNEWLTHGKIKDVYFSKLIIS